MSSKEMYSSLKYGHAMMLHTNIAEVKMFNSGLTFTEHQLFREILCSKLSDR